MAAHRVKMLEASNYRKELIIQSLKAENTRLRKMLEDAGLLKKREQARSRDVQAISKAIDKTKQMNSKTEKEPVTSTPNSEGLPPTGNNSTAPVAPAPPAGGGGGGGPPPAPAIPPAAPIAPPAATAGGGPPPAPAIPQNIPPTIPGPTAASSPSSPNSPAANSPSSISQGKKPAPKAPDNRKECLFCHFMNPEKSKFCQSCAKKIGDKPQEKAPEPSVSSSAKPAAAKPSPTTENLPPYKCLKCGFENPGKAKYCQSCSTKKGDDGSNSKVVKKKIVPQAKPKLLISKKKPGSKAKTANTKDASEPEQKWTCKCGFSNPMKSKFCQSCAKPKPT